MLLYEKETKYGQQGKNSQDIHLRQRDDDAEADSHRFAASKTQEGGEGVPQNSAETNDHNYSHREVEYGVRDVDKRNAFKYVQQDCKKPDIDIFTGTEYIGGAGVAIAEFGYILFKKPAPDPYRKRTGAQQKGTQD